MDPTGESQIPISEHRELPSGPSFRRKFLIPFWIRAIPFFLSAFFYLSGIFAVFSPLPLLWLNLMVTPQRLPWLFVSLVTNLGLVLLLSGSANLAVYAVFVVVLAIALPIFLRALRSSRLGSRSVDLSVVLTLVAMLVAAAAAWWIYAKSHHFAPVRGIKEHFNLLVDHLLKEVPTETKRDWLRDTDPEEWKMNLLWELPSGVVIFSLLLIWANLLLVLRLNPVAMRERYGLESSYFKRWKAPEWLVWPVILTGALVVWDFGKASDIAVSVLKVLMTVYALQGLAILSTVFDVWKIRGVFRTLGFLVVVFLMLPLLLALGFFDQWFDFRAKFRQS